MGAKKSNWSAVKEMVFTYLAINKIMYWMGFVANIEQGDMGGVGRAVISRVIYQDAPLILGVVAFFFLDRAITMKRTKYSKIMENVMFYAIGFVIIMGIYVVYLGILSLFTPITFAAESFGAESWVAVIGSAFLMYLVASIVLNIKQYFKDKVKSDNTTQASSTDRLSMLNILLEDGILTQEEFDNKKEKVLAIY